MPEPIRVSPSTPSQTNRAGTYTVKPGDTLSTIAKNQLGDSSRWPEIMSLNKGILSAPEKLGAGMVLSLPAGTGHPAQVAQTTRPAQTPASPQVQQPTTPPVRPNSVDGFDRVVSLTFDDGPHPVNTPRVLEILKQHDVKATFFVTGQAALKYPDLIKRIVAEGHAIGNHTFTHADLSKLSPDQAKAEFDKTQAAIDKALGQHYEISMVRPPYGAGGKTTRAAMGPNQHMVLWNVDSNDWRYRNDDAKIMANIFEGSESVHARGGVILFHDIHPQTVRILDDVLSKLQKGGFDIQRTDATIGRKNPVII
ncbi:MAG: polysaccharide deacetylase family protein [Deltaproteobacteria bacterium]|nr:polysaccharide deacetylase family protein [Deltaproteobacteria bacterium]